MTKGSKFSRRRHKRVAKKGPTIEEIQAAREEAAREAEEARFNQRETHHLLEPINFMTVVLMKHYLAITSILFCS